MTTRFYSISLYSVSAAFAALMMTPALAQNATAETQSATADTVVTQFSDMAQATYQDAANAVETLKEDVSNLLREPTQENLDEARLGWQTARVVYKQAELFRYASPQMAELVYRVDARPLDEGFLDYVSENYVGSADNPLANFNLIAQPSISIGDVTIEWEDMSSDVIREQLHFAGGNEQNIAAGFPAIEFLLWGEDLGEGEFGEGNRPIEDFDLANCSDDFCNHRGTYLLAAIELLGADLANMANKWDVTGFARAAMLEDPTASLKQILTAMGSVAIIELGANNLAAGIEGDDAELELDAFSDYAFASHLLTARGLMNSYLGEYFTLDGDVVAGDAVSDMLIEADEELDRRFRLALSVTAVRVRTVIRHTRDEEALDEIFANKSEAGLAKINELLVALEKEAALVQEIATVLGLGTLNFGQPAKS